MWRVAVPERAMGNLKVKYMNRLGKGICTKLWAKNGSKCPTVSPNAMAHPHLVGQEQDYLTTRYPLSGFIQKRHCPFMNLPFLSCRSLLSCLKT